MTDVKQELGKDLEASGDQEKPNALQMALLNNAGTGGISLAHIAGTCLTTDTQWMKKIIFWASRGLALTYFHDIREPLVLNNGWEEYKSVFIVLFQETESISKKLKLICDSFSNNKMVIPTEDIRAKIS